MVQTATATTAAPENPTAIFDIAITDAERLLKLFDKLSKPEQQANEVLKRSAGDDKNCMRRSYLTPLGSDFPMLITLLGSLDYGVIQHIPVNLLIC